MLGDDMKTEPNACEVVSACARDRQGRANAVVTVLHDLTREREISQMKSEFVSKASHELRTPLSSMRAYVEMLVDGEAADEATRQFRAVDEAVAAARPRPEASSMKKICGHLIKSAHS